MIKALTLMAAALLAVSAFAQKDAVAPGFDFWKTVGDGGTYMDFAENPIPAGFFFDGSDAFTGRIDFEGVPLATHPADALKGSDTIVERLDSAHFGDDGVAITRMRIKALALASAEPVVVNGTLWDVSVSLADVQPVTELTFVKETERDGYFNSDLVVNVRMTFTHQVNKKLSYALERTVHFSEYFEFPIAYAEMDRDQAQKASAALGQVLVDTNGDGVPDANLMSTLPALGIERLTATYLEPITTEEELEAYHQAPTHQHQTTYVQLQTLASAQ